MGKRTGRLRGAPVGNTNRLKHGRYSAHRLARRAKTQALIRRARNLIRKIEMMAWSRKALREKMAKLVTPGEPTRSAWAREGGPGRMITLALSTWVPFPSRHWRVARPGMTKCAIRGSPLSRIARFVPRARVALLRSANTRAANAVELDQASARTMAYPYWHQKQFKERNPFPTRV